MRGSWKGLMMLSPAILRHFRGARERRAEGEASLVRRHRHGRESERLHDGVVQRGTNLGDLVVFSRGVHAIGQENHKELAIGINPDGGAGKAGVAETMRREEMAARAAFGGNDPADGAGAAGKLLRRG